MLLVSNISGLFVVYASYKLIQIDKDKLSLCWMLGIAVSLQDVTFSVAHHFIAQEYHRISHEIPRIIEGLPFTESYFRQQSIIWWVLLVCNVFFPMCEAVVLIPYNK